MTRLFSSHPAASLKPNNHIRKLLLQWHITERCNLRCAHCYQEGYSGNELGFRELLGVIEQFKELLKLTGDSRGHITVTGGEPFMRQDFLSLLEVIAENRECFSFAVLTNGTFIDECMAHRLRELGPSFVQVSIEGTETTHDRIRGGGNFRRTVSAIRNLVKERIRRSSRSQLTKPTSGSSKKWQSLAGSCMSQEYGQTG